jgi:arginyl-tRNA synthetase
MKKTIQKLLARVLEGMGIEDIAPPAVSVPENPAHGDYSTNVAIILSPKYPNLPAGEAGLPNFPNLLKNAIIKDQTISDAGIIDRVEVAGSGFLNIYLTEASLINQVSEVLKMKDTYGFALKTSKIYDLRSTISVSDSKKTVQKQGKKTGEKPPAATGSLTTQKPLNISRKTDAGSNPARQKAISAIPSGSEIIPESGQNRLTGDPPKRRKRIMIEFADPNPFKEIHIGHVRNIALGESFCRLMESQGNVVYRANYEGDVGLHVAKSLWGLERLATDGVDVSGIGLDVRGKAALLGRAYAVGSKAFEAPSADGSAADDINNLNKKIYAMDESIVAQWRRDRQWSLDYFYTVYEKLGTHFDRYYFESEAAPIGVVLVEKHLSDKIFEKSDGAIVYRGEKVGLHTRVFITKEHYATYEAKDMALAPLKYSEWPYDLSIIMTGNEQSEYFKVMLAALAQINPDLAAKTRHMPFGMVRLTTGKMSSRTGDVITADWLIEEAKKRIYIILDSNRTNYSKKMKDDIAQKAAIAAIKYSMLRVNAISDIAFDLVASVSFDGDSGPYLQYTYARAKSVLRKASSPVPARHPCGQALAGGSPLSPLCPLNPEERALARQIMQFPDVVAEAAGNFSPNTICTYLFHLAQQFNLFYAKHQILPSDSPNSPSTHSSLIRLALTAATAQTIKNGLYLLGIETMEQM